MNFPDRFTPAGRVLVVPGDRCAPSVSGRGREAGIECLDTGLTGREKIPIFEPVRCQTFNGILSVMTMNNHLPFQTILAAAVAFAVLGAVQPAGAQSPASGTCSIVARDPVTGDLGIAVQSGIFAVGSVVPWASSAAGAVATQARANTAYGPDGIRMLGYGWSAAQALDTLLAGDPDSPSRQVAIVDKNGGAAAYTGPGCQPYAGHKIGSGYVVQGNMLAGSALLDSMAAAFERTPGDLAARLLAALAGARAGSEPGRRSAALLVVREEGGYNAINDRFIDLRVDDHADPVGELRRLYALWSSTASVASRLATIDRFNRNKQFSAAQEETRRLVEDLNARLRENPDNPEVLNSVAGALSTSGIARDRALELATRAVKLAPSDLRFKDTLAECHFGLGHNAEAVRIASEIVAKEPGNAYYRGQLQKYLDAQPK
jgi:uncharacterized Ntn-hydrolase superfamily protein